MNTTETASRVQVSVMNYLDRNKIPHGLLGFQYLHDGICYLLMNGDTNRSASYIYEAVANANSVSPMAVRHSIARAIRSSPVKEKPKEFMMSAVDRIRCEEADSD